MDTVTEERVNRDGVTELKKWNNRGNGCVILEGDIETEVVIGLWKNQEGAGKWRHWCYVSQK